MKTIFPRLVLGGAVALAGVTAHANVLFNLIPDVGTPQFAIDGFNAAASLWSARLANNITVNVNIGYTSLAPGVLGSTGSASGEVGYAATRAALNASAVSADDFSAYAALQTGANYTRLINHTSNNPNGANSATPYLDTMNRVGLTLANARALGLFAAADATVDASITFSSNFAFDFNPADGISAGQYDFIGVAAHELGHALGFVSGVDDIDFANGSNPGGDFSSNVLDLFRYSDLSRSIGLGVSDYSADGRNKYFSLDGGATAIASFATGVTFGDGRQASHWKDNLGIGIMDPTAGTGELLTISATDLRSLDVIGYSLVPTPVPEPASLALLGLGAAGWGWTRSRRRNGSTAF